MLRGEGVWTKRPRGPVESECVVSVRVEETGSPAGFVCHQDEPPPWLGLGGVKWPPSGFQAAEPDAVLRALRGKGSPLPAKPPARRPHLALVWKVTWACLKAGPQARTPC